MTCDYSIPEVTYEASTKTANYLYIKEHASLWDTVVNLCLKVEKTYPYVSYPNNIRFTKHQNPKMLYFENYNQYISHSECQDYTKVVSNIHMRDLDGTYDTFNKQNQFAVDRKIIRHKHINYDRQWTSLEDAGLGYKINYTMRGNNSTQLLYKGFLGEDINDTFCIKDTTALSQTK